MTCARCQGCLVRERFSDLFDDTGQLGFRGWRCLNCGDVFDRVVLAHRAVGVVRPYRSQRRWSAGGRRVDGSEPCPTEAAPSGGHKMVVA
jgi:hypothetical protein